MRVRLYNRFFIIYLLLFIFFFLVAYDSFPVWYDAFMQLFMLLYGWIIGYLIVKSRGKGLFFKVFIFQLLCVLLKAYINQTFYGDYVGPNAIDAIDYRDYGVRHGNLNYITFFRSVLQNGEDYDDWGFITIIWFCYNLFGRLGYWALLFINIIVVSITAKRVYKLSKYFLSRDYALLLVAIWSIMPFAIETSVGFLKENFFSLVVVSSFLYIYKYIDRKSINNLLGAIIWCLGISFFRMALGYAMILSLIAIFFIDSPFLKKHLLSVIVFVSLPLLLVVPFVITFLLSKRGLSMEALLFVRTEGIIGVIVDYITGFFGPFPKFIGDSHTVKYMTFSSFSSLVKTLLSPFFWFEIIYILRKGKTKYLPMVILILCNLFMLIISHYAIQLRFQWPHMIVFFIIAGVGYVDFMRNKSIKRIYFAYLCVMLLIIYKYNIGL